MKFYDVDNALQEAIEAAEKTVRLKIEIQINGHFESVTENDIIEADFFSINEAAGGVSSRGEVLLSINNEYLKTGNAAGKEVRVSFSIGEGLPFFQRFVFYIDDKGIQDIRGNGRKRFVRLSLRDLSYKLRKTDEARDWTSPAVFTYSVVCDKTQPEKSLVHGIARRAGLAVNDIDCCTIPVTLAYVKLRRNIWSELSSMAAAYRCHLECAPEKPLVFAHSPYQSEAAMDSSDYYNFFGKEIFYLRLIEKSELYRNTVRLKINLPVSLEKQQIWRYEDPPVIYDDDLQAHYPFKDSLVREIESGNYEAKYRIIDENGKERNVVYADEIDTKEEAESRLEYDGMHFAYSQYDITTCHDKAVLKLHKEGEGDLYNASIHGRPIVLDLNRSCFKKDSEGVENYGTAALNVTGSYFSEYEIDSKPHYEDWVIRELADRIEKKLEITLKTHKAVFNSRVGAKIKIVLSDKNFAGTINALSFRYRRDKAFIASFKITETRGEL
jgi:hypothetical protein